MVEAIGGNSAEEIKRYIERVTRLEDEKADLAADIREVYMEAKGNGFDVKALRQLVKLTKMETAKRQEEEEMLRIYRQAIGMDFLE